MVNVLWISLVGMGMVFIVILLLWGLMALLVRLTREKDPEQISDRSQTIRAVQPQELSDQKDGLNKRRAAAAAAAVAVVLALSKENIVASSNQPEVTISPWLAVQRASRLNRSAQLYRKRVAR